MRVLLCTSPHIRHAAVLHADFEDRDGFMYSFVPVGLLSLAAVIRQSRQFDVCLFDTNEAINMRSAASSKALYAVLAEQICAIEADVVGFMTESDSYHHVLQICAEIRTRCPETPVVLGGPHASATAQATLKRWPCIDAVCIGEGETTVLPLLHSLLSSPRSAVPGAVIRGSNGELLSAGRARLVENLDDLPIPTFEMYVPKDGEEIFLEVGRGCPFACTFCSTAPYWERQHRVKSPQRIVDEIAHLNRLYGVRRFHFTHDLFTTDRRWALGVAQAIGALDVIPNWTCSARADRVDPELLEEMAKGGCNAIYYGIESGSPRVLSSIKKDIPWGVTEAAIENSIAAGIQPNAGLIVGFREDDVESVVQTFDTYTWLLQKGAKPVHIFGFCPFNGAASFDPTDNSGAQKHFLDMPLPSETDSANRQLVVSDPLLFSVYRRIPNASLAAIAPGFIEGIDEFTPLIESCLLSSLIFVSHGVPILILYKEWLAWIAARNDSLGRNAHRRFYGGPLQFVQFLAKRAAQMSNRRPDLVAYLDLLERSFTNSTSDLRPVSMASFRSGIDQPQFSRSQIEKGVQVSADHVVESFCANWDLSELLNWEPAKSIPPPVSARCGYVFQRFGDQAGIRLLQVDPAIAELLDSLRFTPLDAASVWAERVQNRGALGAAGIDGVIEAIIDAGTAGLIHVHEEA